MSSGLLSCSRHKKSLVLCGCVVNALGTCLQGWELRAWEAQRLVVQNVLQVVRGVQTFERTNSCCCWAAMKARGKFEMKHIWVRCHCEDNDDINQVEEIQYVCRRMRLNCYRKWFQSRWGKTGSKRLSVKKCLEADQKRFYVFFRIALCVRRAIPKFCFRNIPDADWFSKHK